MAENMTPAEETKEVVSKNFIEQEIDKDLAEGVYDHVQSTAESSIFVLMIRTRRRRRRSSCTPSRRM